MTQSSSKSSTEPHSVCEWSPVTSMVLRNCDDVGYEPYPYTAHMMIFMVLARDGTLIESLAAKKQVLASLMSRPRRCQAGRARRAKGAGHLPAGGRGARRAVPPGLCDLPQERRPRGPRGWAGLGTKNLTPGGARSRRWDGRRTIKWNPQRSRTSPPDPPSPTVNVGDRTLEARGGSTCFVPPDPCSIASGCQL